MQAPPVNRTPLEVESRKQKHREEQQRYTRTEKGHATHYRYDHSEKGLARNRKYEQTAGRKIYKRLWLRIPQNAMKHRLEMQARRANGF